MVQAGLSGVRIPGVLRDFSCLHNAYIDSELPLSLLLNRFQHSFWGIMWLWHHFLLLKQVVLGKLFYAVVLGPTACKFSCLYWGLFEDSCLLECDNFSLGEWEAIVIPHECITFIHSFIHLLHTYTYIHSFCFVQSRFALRLWIWNMSKFRTYTNKYYIPYSYLHVRHSQSLVYISPSYLHTNKATYIVK